MRVYYAEEKTERMCALIIVSAANLEAPSIHLELGNDSIPYPIKQERRLLSQRN
jgi:hypothetical protein